jgi:hypothetical protein
MVMGEERFELGVLGRAQSGDVLGEEEVWIGRLSGRCGPWIIPLMFSMHCLLPLLFVALYDISTTIPERHHFTPLLFECDAQVNERDSQNAVQPATQSRSIPTPCDAK